MKRRQFIQVAAAGTAACVAGQASKGQVVAQTTAEQTHRSQANDAKQPAGNLPQIAYRRAVPVVNDDFEQGLTGWKVAGKDRIYTTASEHTVGVKRGKKMAGWTMIGGRKRQQVFRESSISQRIATAARSRSSRAVRAPPHGYCS